MNRQQSLVLDVLRFTAAFVVFLNHASAQSYTDGFLWQTRSYAQTSVIMFFVISGYVIGYVADRKENNFLDYSKARLARLYSVVIPALLLTFLCNYIVFQNEPAFYGSLPGANDAHSMKGYLLSAVFLTTIWDPSLGHYPGTNNVFWSLSYEFFYYLVFGTAFLLNTRYRYVIAAACAAIAGPSIMSLFPIWLAGYLAYRGQWDRHLGRTAGWALLVIGMSGLAASPAIRELLALQNSDWFRESVIGDNVDGIFAVCLIIGAFAAAQGKQMVSAPAEKLIRFLASLTFALYLFHRPLLGLFAWLAGDDPGSTSQRIIVLAGTALVIGIFGTWCEARKGTVRKFFDRLLPSDAASLLPLTAVRVPGDNSATKGPGRTD